MKTFALTLLLPALLAGVAHAGEPAAAPQNPSQSQLALDHGPHAQVTPAVKRARQAAAAAASAASQSR